MRPALRAAVCSFVLLGLPFCSGGIDRGSVNDLPSETVTYQTEDGVRIVAGWFVPENEARPRVVILLHEQGGTRAQWNDLIYPLVKKGYAVLAPDLRGHGESNIIVRDGQEQPYQFGDKREAVLDVQAALRWLEGKSAELNLNFISIVGARLGADLAYVSTGIFPNFKAGVAITPSPYDPADPLFALIKDFQAHDIFFMAGGEEPWIAAASVGVRVQNPGGRRYIDHPDLDGVALMTIDEPIEDLLDWLRARFESPIPTTTVQ